MTSIDLSNSDAWDDSALIRSWNEALDEYKRYHSIHARGEKVEDALNEHELAQLRRERQLQRDGGPKRGEPGAMLDDSMQEDAEIGAEVNGDHPGEQQQHTTSSAEKTAPAANTTATMPNAASMPQMMLGSVQDEALKNLMMSWYYAGYYTGLYEGQQRAMQCPKSEPSRT